MCGDPRKAPTSAFSYLFTMEMTSPAYSVSEAQVCCTEKGDRVSLFLSFSIILCWHRCRYFFFGFVFVPLEWHTFKNTWTHVLKCKTFFFHFVK